MKSILENKVTIKAPIGMKIKECVNCLWYSNFNKGSDADLMKISRSGAKPAKHPTIDPTKIFFLLEIVWANAHSKDTWNEWKDKIEKEPRNFYLCGGCVIGNFAEKSKQPIDL